MFRLTGAMPDHGADGLFETAPDDSLIRWEIIDVPRALTNSFAAVLAGITMVRAGQIS